MDAAWDYLVEQVLLEVDPDEIARLHIRRRLHDSGELGLLFSTYKQGGQDEAVKRILKRLAEQWR